MGVPIQSILVTVFQVNEHETRRPPLTRPSRYSRSFSCVSPGMRSHSRASLISPLQRYACLSLARHCSTAAGHQPHQCRPLYPRPLVFKSRLFPHTSETPPAMGHPHLLCCCYRSVCTHCIRPRSSLPSQTIPSVRPLALFSSMSLAHCRNFATAASMFMNSNSLPVALMASLATTVPLLKWGPDDTFDAMFGRSLTYLVVFSTLGMIVSHPYAIQRAWHSLLRPPESLARCVS